jgi:hypothetical protein
MLNANANWLMPNDGTIYVIDVDVLARIHVRKDSQTIYDALIGMAEAKTLRTVRQTFDELRRFGPVNDILKGHRDLFQISADDQFHAEVSAYICGNSWQSSLLSMGTNWRQKPRPGRPVDYRGGCHI